MKWKCSKDMFSNKFDALAHSQISFNPSRDIMEIQITLALRQ